jgi:predicted metal-dependent phosphoesterase TrpH
MRSIDQMKVDMHVHTVYSGDSTCKPSGVMRAARSRGIDGIAVTDHNSTKAWKEVLKEGRRNGIAVILGEEVEVELEGRVVGELLGYFLDDEVKKGDLGEVLDEITSQGGLIALPHPFCFWRGMRIGVEEVVKRIHAVEVFNSGMYLNSQNGRALELARKHKLAEIGGSDAHTEHEVGNAYTYAEADGLEEFRTAIIKRKTRAEGKLSSHVLRVISKLLDRM